MRELRDNLGTCSNSPIRTVSGDALVNGTPRQKDAKGKNVRSATSGSPRKRKSGEEGKKSKKKKKPEYVLHIIMRARGSGCQPLRMLRADFGCFLVLRRDLNVSVSDDECTDSFSTDSSFGWLNSPYAVGNNKSADAAPSVANFWQESPMGIGPSARLEGHFSPVTPLPDAVRVRSDSPDESAQTAGASKCTGEAPPPSPEHVAKGRLTVGGSDDSGASLSGGEADPELCIIGRALALRSSPSSISPPWSNSSPDSPVLPPGARAGSSSSTNSSQSGSMTDYKLMSTSKGDDLYAELLQAQGVDVSPRDEDDRGPSAFFTASTIKAEAADSATWRCVSRIHCICLLAEGALSPCMTPCLFAYCSDATCCGSPMTVGMAAILGASGSGGLSSSPRLSPLGFCGLSPLDPKASDRLHIRK